MVKIKIAFVASYTHTHIPTNTHTHTLYIEYYMAFSITALVSAWKWDFHIGLRALDQGQYGPRDDIENAM